MKSTGLVRLAWWPFHRARRRSLV